MAGHPVRTDKLIAVVYLAVLPLAIAVVATLSLIKDRQQSRQAKRVSARAEAIAVQSCKVAAIFRDASLALVLEGSHGHLSDKQVVILRDAATKLQRLSCVGR